jgi:hypothetical protein
LFNLPRNVLAEVVVDFARALVPGRQVLIGTHDGEQDAVRLVKPFERARRPVSVRKQRQIASDAGLSKQRVVVEAVRIADREGVDGLSMRRLAGALGAGAMSLYHYVASKEELLDAMIDVVFEEIELPPEETDWQSAMRRRAVSARRFSHATRGRSA